MTQPDERALYLRNRRLRSILLPLGYLFLIASYGVANLFMLLPVPDGADSSAIAKLLDEVMKVESHEVVDISFSSSHVLAPLSFIAMITVGIVILRYAKEDREAFIDAFDHIMFSYGEEEVIASRRIARGWCIAGAIILAAAIAGLILLLIYGKVNLALGCGFIGGGIGVACISHGILSLKGYDIYVYNYDALKAKSIYEIERDAQADGGDVLVSIKRLSIKVGDFNRVLLTVGLLASIACYLLPSLETGFYWVPLVAAFVIDFVVTHACIRKSISFYESRPS